MNTSLANLTDNLSEINNIDRKKCMERDKIKPECQYIKYNKNKLIYKCKKCNDKSYKSVYDLTERFANTYQFCNKDLNKFMLLLRKGVYPYECMESQERFNECELPPKESFDSELNLEDITDEDYSHAQKLWHLFETKTQANVITYMFNLTHYSLQMYLNIFEKHVSKYINQILHISYLLQEKKTRKKDKSKSRITNTY